MKIDKTDVIVFLSFLIVFGTMSTLFACYGYVKEAKQTMGLGLILLVVERVFSFLMKRLSDWLKK